MISQNTLMLLGSLNAVLACIPPFDFISVMNIIGAAACFFVVMYRA